MIKAIKITRETLPLVLTVADLADVLQIGLNSAYELVSSGQICVIRIKKSIRIPQDALLKYLNTAS